MPRDELRVSKFPCLFPAKPEAFSTSYSHGRQHELVRSLSTRLRAYSARTPTSPTFARARRVRPPRFAKHSARGDNCGNRPTRLVRARHGADQDGSPQIRINTRGRHRDSESGSNVRCNSAVKSGGRSIANRYGVVLGMGMEDFMRT